MSKFNLHDFVMGGLKEAIGNMSDYQVTLTAAGWHAKGVLNDDDLILISALIKNKNDLMNN